MDVAKVALLNEPEPLVVHDRVEAAPPIEPAKVYAPLAQMVASEAALAVAIGLIVIELLCVTDEQPLAAAIVLVTVKVPAELPERFTKPELELIDRPDVAVNVPATPPPVNVGKGLLPLIQYGVAE